MIKNVHLIDQNLLLSRFLVDITDAFFDDVKSIPLLFFFDNEFSLKVIHKSATKSDWYLFVCFIPSNMGNFSDFVVRKMVQELNFS